MIIMCVDAVLQTYPGDEGSTEGEVEEPFVRDGENDESRRESEEENH